MAKVYTKKARKDYPKFGIKKGDTYYAWTVGFRGKEQKSLKRPSRSQTTSNGVNATVWDLYDGDTPDNADDLEAFAQSLRDAASEEQEKLDNMPEGFQSGDTGSKLQERIEALEGAADEVDNIASKVRDGEDAEKGTDPDLYTWSNEEEKYVLDMDALKEELSGTEPSL